MNEVIFLDTGVLGLVCIPKSKVNPARDECLIWLDSLVAAGKIIVIPEICDYELRRELIRLNKTKSIERLETIKADYDYLPINTEMMLKAAELWADVRRRGLPTADDKALDGDVILAAQMIVSDAGRGQVIVATTNVDDLSRMVPAKEWRDIS